MRTEQSFTVRLLIVLAAAAALAGCSLTAVVVDRSETKTSLSKPHLEGDQFFRILLGGAVREIPLKEIRMIKVDPSESITFERQLYFAAQVILRDATVLSEAGGDSTMNRQCYIAVHNSIAGTHNGERFSIPLQNIVQLKILQ